MKRFAGVRRPTLEGFRLSLSRPDALPQLALLAVLAGALTGIVILAFRGAIDLILANLLPGGDPEGFETLGLLQRLTWPVTGAAVLAVIFWRLPPAALRFGVAHVLERLIRHQGYLPARNAVAEFFGGIVALSAGVSGGREGPAIHLGAASASLMGQAARLPNNALRTLVGCGTAAAIAGSFNTPLAGVIFAMEVVMKEYTIGSFIPVILAAVTATVLTQYALGPEPAFSVAPLQLNSLLEIPYIVACGVGIGVLAAAYIQMVQLFARHQARPFWLRALAAGSITGIAAIAVPQVMGVGYDTVDAAITGQLVFTTLVAVVVLKSITSAAAVGLGLPVGIIGPTFVIGAAAGGVLGIAGGYWQPDAASGTGLYVMLGMAAMMAAVLQAPLAALVAVLELTANPNVILPAMLVIVVATLVASVPLRQRSVFDSTLSTLDAQHAPSPATAHLRRAGVAAIMSRQLARLPSVCSQEAAHRALDSRPRWIVVEQEPGHTHSVLGAADLLAWLEANPGAETVRLLQIPANRRDATDIDDRATIDEAQQRLRGMRVEALCVRRTSAPMIATALGVILQDDIDNYRETAL